MSAELTPGEVRRAAEATLHAVAPHRPAVGANG
jgi:hypothetical protein